MDTLSLIGNSKTKSLTALFNFAAVFICMQVSAIAQVANGPINTHFIETSVFGEVNRLRYMKGAPAFERDGSLDLVCAKLAKLRFDATNGLSTHQTDQAMKDVFGDKQHNYTAGFLLVSYDLAYQENEKDIVELFFQKQVQQNEIGGLLLNGETDFNAKMKSKMSLQTVDDGNGKMVICYMVYHARLSSSNQ